MGRLRQARITELRRQRCGKYASIFFFITAACAAAIAWAGYVNGWRHLSEEQLFSLIRQWWVMGVLGLGTLSGVIALCCALRGVAIGHELRRRIPDWDA